MAYLYPWGNTQQLNLDWILQKIKDLETSASAAVLDEISNALLAASYAAQAYEQFDIVFYDGKLYLANTDIAAPGEAWTPAHWDEILLGGPVSALLKHVTNLGSDNVINDSQVTGDTVSDALNTLENAIDNMTLDSDSVTNESQVTGTNVSDALDTLDSAIASAIAFNPYDLPTGNITTLDYLKNNITSNGIWTHYFYLPAYNFVGWGKIVAIVTGTYKKIYITLMNYEAYIGTDDGITWSDLIVTPVLTHSYETAVTMQTTFINALETAFTNASNYSLFSGGSGAGNEGGWVCFKHSTTAMGLLFNYSWGVCALRRDTTGTWTANTIFKF